MELSKTYFGPDFISDSQTVGDEEKSALLASSGNSDSEKSAVKKDGDNGTVPKFLKTLVWYVFGMPLWILLASLGKESLTTYVTEMALKSPHPIRIGNVRFARAKEQQGGKSFTRVVMLQNNNKNSTSNAGRVNLSTKFSDAASDSEDSGPLERENYKRFDSLTTKLVRADSLNTYHKMQTTRDGTVVALPALSFTKPLNGSNGTKDYQSINQKIGAMAKQRSMEGEDIAIEDDPQGDPPGIVDFVVAISYIMLGMVAMVAGLTSIFLK